MNTEGSDPVFLTATEVKKILRMSNTAFWQHVSRGNIPAYKIGGTTYRFKKDEVLATLKPVNIK